MFFGGMIECSAQVYSNERTNEEMTTTIQSSTTYWTSTAFAVDTTTTTTNAKTIASSTCSVKWIGEDTPYDCRRWDDDEDTDNDESSNHKFGLCCTCKKGLDDRADFVCNNNTRQDGGFYMLCTQCHEDFNNAWYLEETHGDGA
jgi:hypothetical protein